MELTLDRPGDHHFVRSVSADGIRIADRLYPGPLVLSAERLLDDWPVYSLRDLNEATLQPVFELEPEIVLIGTGAVQRFLSPELMMCFFSRDIGLEVMTTAAACRTFNVLASEQRNVAAALLPPAADADQD
jgi:uncharacterized protein